MSSNGKDLFNLLPAFHRIRDAQIVGAKSLLSAADRVRLQNLQALPSPLNPVMQAELEGLLAKAARGPLESLLMLIGEQLAAVEEDLNQFYDDEFIETCAPWVIPYIGDLIGYQPVHGVAAAVASPRSEVARTISFRRRKGTVLVLEQLARDVTGWGAHAVEFFKELAVTQYMKHVRLHNHYAPDLRGWKPRLYMDTGFDTSAHKVDVRRIAIQRGRYNIQNIGIFLWSLNAYSITMSPAPAVAASTQCFRFSSLGADLPLFNNPVSQGPDITAPAKPLNVPDRLRRHVLCRDLWPDQTPPPPPVYYGVGNSLALYLNGALVDPRKVMVCDLSGPEGAWANIPTAASNFTAAIDPQLGRIALSPQSSPAPQLQASYFYGFNADLGGGEYPREATFTAAAEQTLVRVPGDYPTIQQAINALPGDGVVEVTDGNIYQEPSGLQITVGAEGQIELRAQDGCRPTLVLGSEVSVSGGTNSQFNLNGFILTYAPPASGATPPTALIHAPNVASNLLHILGLAHCTLVPGWALNPQGGPQTAYAFKPAVLADCPGMELQVQKCILGALWVNAQATANVADSIVDATDPTGVAYVASIDATGQNPVAGGALTLSGVTVFGKVYATLLDLVTNCLFWASLSPADLAMTPPTWHAPLWSDRKQAGCVRFSYLPRNAIAPRQFECVEESDTSPQPVFVSQRYGEPGYGKLFPVTDPLIWRGADDGGEMGGFHFLLAPLRETDLRVRMQEYLPVGLEFGIFYET